MCHGLAFSGAGNLFHANGWGDSWRNEIYPYQHYRSAAHEALGVFSGAALVLLGGGEGIE
jgi:uncharacterized protein YjlB